MSERQKIEEVSQVFGFEYPQFKHNVDEILRDTDSCSFRFEPHLIGAIEVARILRPLMRALERDAYVDLAGGKHKYKTELRAHLPLLAQTDTCYRNEQPIKYELIIRKR